jgi:hypothetical protein
VVYSKNSTSTLSNQSNNLKFKLNKMLLTNSNSPPSDSVPFSKSALYNVESSGEKSSKSRNQIVKDNLTTQAVKKMGDLQIVEEDSSRKNPVLDQITPRKEQKQLKPKGGIQTISLTKSATKKSQDKL